MNHGELIGTICAAFLVVGVLLGSSKADPPPIPVPDNTWAQEIVDQAFYADTNGLVGTNGIPCQSVTCHADCDVGSCSISCKEGYACAAQCTAAGTPSCACVKMPDHPHAIDLSPFGVER